MFKSMKKSLKCSAVKRDQDPLKPFPTLLNGADVLAKGGVTKVYGCQ